jgi:microcystin-dependent protein
LQGLGFGAGNIPDGSTSLVSGCSNQYLGEVWMFAGNFAPPGTHVADGTLLPINQNTALFSLLGTNYGGNGVSTFALPDLRAFAPGGVSYVICLEGIFPSR